MDIGIYQTVREIHLEPTSNCNARCPQCPRTLHTSLDTHPNLEIGEWAAAELEKTLNHSFFDNVTRLQINGNFGDLVMHSDPRSLLEVILKKNYKMVDINTNGGAQGVNFWKWLGSTNIIVNFAIDGLEDTHHLYRRNTRYDIVMKNAKTFIDAGGHAIWVATLFKHNIHQEDQMKELAKSYGFKEYKSRHSTRFQAKKLSVVDKNYNHEYYLEPADLSLQTPNIKQIDKKPIDFYTSTTHNETGDIVRYNDAVECYAQQDSTVFLSYDKRLWPCCHIGIGFELSGKYSWWKDTLFEIFKNDFKQDADFNNVIKYNIDDIVYNTKLFQRIETTWNTDNVCTSCVMNCRSNSNVQLQLKNQSNISLN